MISLHSACFTAHISALYWIMLDFSHFLCRLCVIRVIYVLEIGMVNFNVLLDFLKPTAKRLDFSRDVYYTFAFKNSGDV